jgi:hypothetical protein
MKKNLFFLLIGVLTASAVYAQEVLPNNPPALKWYQVNTAHFRVLFPEGFDVQAQRMANTLEHLHDAEARTLGGNARKISVLLQNQSSVSNGFVSQLPRRSEFYTMPPQDYNFIGTNDWLNLLASHEYRHIVQYQHANRGFNRVFYYLFGSPTFAGFSQVAAPPWFWEGDAVATETAFTPSGRGRIPNFGLVFRSNLLEGRTFNYHKQHLRSYKNFIPDHYVLGYHMISYLRMKTQDPEIWEKITARSWSVPFVPFAFSNAIKNQTGMYVTDLYRDMAAELKKEWQAEIDQLQVTPFEKVHQRKGKAYTDYLYPQPQEDGSVLVMKKGIGDIEQFVTLKDGKEKKIFTPGFVNDAGMLSAHSSVVLWNEYGYNPRWRVKNFSLVKLYDIRTGKKRIIGNRHDRLGSAALAPDGGKIVAVRSDTEYKNTLLIFEFFTGKVLQEFSDPENSFYSMPRWSDDGSKIVVLKTTPKGKTITLLDVAANTAEDVFPASRENFGHPVLLDHYLFFNSPVSGIDNIYAYDLRSKKRYQVTSSKYGAYNPAISKDISSIYYNEQSKDGLDVVRVPFDPSQWKEFEPKPEPKSLHQNLVEQEGRPGLLDSIPQNTLPVTRYSKLKGMINPYSWGFNISNDLTQLHFGIASRDLLSTTSIAAGYAYDINEKSSLWQVGVSYQGLYPIIDLVAQTGDRKTTHSWGANSSEFTWNETTAEGGLRIPLLLTHSKYSEQLSIGNAVGITKATSFVNTIKKNGEVIYKGPDRIMLTYQDTLAYIYKDQLNNGDLLYNHFSLSYYRLLKTSYRDFLYRWGQTLAVDVYNTPFTGDFQGRLWAVRSTLYFPGFAKHHYIYGRGAYQESLQGFETDFYTFRNRIPKPRGHSYPTDEKFLSLSANYALPLWYPDIALGPVLNIQRVKANFFYDYGKGTGHQYYYSETGNVYRTLTDATYESFGVETTFDFNFMRFLPKFELGFRTSYLKANRYTNNGVVFEILIGNIGF